MSLIKFTLGKSYGARVEPWAARPSSALPAPQHKHCLPRAGGGCPHRTGLGLGTKLPYLTGETRLYWLVQCSFHKHLLLTFVYTGPCAQPGRQVILGKVDRETDQVESSG